MKRSFELLFLITFIFLLSGCSDDACEVATPVLPLETSQTVVLPDIPDTKPNLRRFRSCEEMEEYNKTLPTYSYGLDVAPMNSSRCGIQPYWLASDRHNSHGTIGENRHESDVQESDFVKTWNDQIYVAKNTEVSIIDRVTLKKQGSLYFENSQGPIELLVGEKSLVALVPKLGGIESHFFSLSRNLLPKARKKMEFSGYLREASLANDTLLLVFEQDSAKPSSIPCDKIHYLYDASAGARNSVVVHKIKLGTLADDAVGLIQNSVQAVYVTKANLYVADSSYTSTSVVKIKNTFSAEALDFSAIGSIPATLLSEWSLKENLEKNYLAVATHRPTNNLHLLRDNNDGHLKPISEIGAFGNWERMMAVRFLGDYAYIVTFRFTDPLWAIDLAVPEHPVIVGKLEVPGFSSYLHPINGEKLVGIGQDNGTQINLFDIRNPAQLSRIDVKTFNSHSRSEAGSDHRAFFHDNLDSTFGFPIHDSAYLMSASGNTLSQTAKFSHDDISKGARILRIFKIKGVYFTLSNKALKSHEPKKDTFSEKMLAL